MWLRCIYSWRLRAIEGYIDPWNFGTSVNMCVKRFAIKILIKVTSENEPKRKKNIYDGFYLLINCGPIWFRWMKWTSAFQWMDSYWYLNTWRYQLSWVKHSLNWSVFNVSQYVNNTQEFCPARKRSTFHSLNCVIDKTFLYLPMNQKLPRPSKAGNYYDNGSPDCDVTITKFAEAPTLMLGPRT